MNVRILYSMGWHVGLIELYPLKNAIEFQPNFGKLSLVKINGEFEAAWFVQ